MKVLDPGHAYSVAMLDCDERLEGLLTFVKREGEKYPGNVGNHPGTTMQEVLRALVDRAMYVYNQEPCTETESAIELMKAAIVCLEIRAARKHERVPEPIDRRNSIWTRMPSLLTRRLQGA